MIRKELVEHLALLKEQARNSGANTFIWDISQESFNFVIDSAIKALEQEPIIDKIRDQLKSNLRGVEITLEVLVENDPLRPKMEGAKTTLEDCLELIEQAEAESI